MRDAPLRVLLAEDVNMLRGALTALLELQPDIEVVAQVDRGDQVLAAAIERRPDVAVLDLDLPGMDGLAAAAQLRHHLPDCRVLIITGIDKPGMLRRVLQSGVAGLILKSAPSVTLAQAVRDVAAGHRVIGSEVALAFIGEPANVALSPREIEILECTAMGNSAEETAARLFLATGTVRNYLTTISTKLHARTQVDAVRIAREAGLIA